MNQIQHREYSSPVLYPGGKSVYRRVRAVINDFEYRASADVSTRVSEPEVSIIDISFTK